jgi:phosphate starvation-inducible PhoH-like protein
VEARDILTRIKGIHFAYFTEKDVVRHPLVQDIIRAYETLGRGRISNGGAREGGPEPANGEKGGQ